MIDLVPKLRRWWRARHFSKSVTVGPASVIVRRYYAGGLILVAPFAFLRGFLTIREPRANEGLLRSALLTASRAPAAVLRWASRWRRALRMCGAPRRRRRFRAIKRL